MSLKIFIDAASGQFDAAMEAATADLKAASMAAAHEASDILKREGRADIASAGFGSRWQNTFKTVVYPQHAQSTHPTIQAYHVIHYSGIFEEGGAIFGKPMLWLPLPDTPQKVGNNRMTPEIFVKQVGPLFSINRPGQRPLLAAKVLASSGKKPTLADFKAASGRSAAKLLNPGVENEAKRAVPLFVGIEQATLRDRFSIREIAEKVAARLPEIFAAEFN